MGATMAKTRRFHMQFEPMTIEHLGLRLYSTLPPVLAELVSNAFDAESPKVEVFFPTDPITPTTEVVIRDYGHGMSADELEDEYLPIGRNRRGPDSRTVKSKHGRRTVTGRKGLGKLSSFGIAEEMEIRSIRESDAWTLRLNYEEMKRWALHHPGAPYEPTVVAERTGRTNEPDGVELRLRKLRRTRRIDEDGVRHGLAYRLDMIGGSFQVLINGVPIKPGDRARRGDCDQSWDLAKTPVGNTLETRDVVQGWIGFVPGASQTGRGVDIFAHGKAAELASFFNYSTTHAQFARAHLVGEVHADFLDGDEDLIATARNSVVWEAPAAQALQVWGQGLLRWAFEQWLAERRKAKEEEITREAGFDIWLESRQPSEQKAAKRMLRILAEDENLDPASAKPLLEIVKASVETIAFQDLIDTIEAEKASAVTLLRLFAEWRVIEAREHLRLADGRLSAIDKLDEFIEEGALEVQQLQPLLVGHLWMLNRSWSEVSIQPKYSKMLRENCKEPKGLAEKDRRLDIVGVAGGARHMTVVELKRPEKTLSREDLDQIEKYVDWARENIAGGTAKDSPESIEGLLIVGKVSRQAGVREKVRRLAGDNIRVQTYRDLHAAAVEQYKEVEKRLEQVAPEYTRMRRKAGKRKTG